MAAGGQMEIQEAGAASGPGAPRHIQWCADSRLLDRYWKSGGAWAPGRRDELPCANAPSLLQPGSLRRTFTRILRPTGLIVVMDSSDFDSESEELRKVFGHLYFRRCLKKPSWRILILKHLISSTLVQSNRIPALWRILLRFNIIFVASEEYKSAPQKISNFLHNRCVSRYRLS